MNKGDKVKCISPVWELVKGDTYTVRRTFVGNQGTNEATRPGTENEPGVELEEVGGYFFQDRFEVVS